MRHTARRLSLPVVENPCPANGNTKRQEIKELIYELQGRYPGLKSWVFGSMQRPLPGVGARWSTAAALCRKRSANKRENLRQSVENRSPW